MQNKKLYKPTLIIEDTTIYIVNSKILTGLCGREILAKQNNLNAFSIHDSKKIVDLTVRSIKNN